MATKVPGSPGKTRTCKSAVATLPRAGAGSNPGGQNLPHPTTGLGRTTAKVKNPIPGRTPAQGETRLIGPALAEPTARTTGGPGGKFGQRWGCWPKPRPPQSYIPCSGTTMEFFCNYHGAPRRCVRRPDADSDSPNAYSTLTPHGCNGQGQQFPKTSHLLVAPPNSDKDLTPRGRGTPRHQGDVKQKCQQSLTPLNLGSKRQSTLGACCAQPHLETHLAPAAASQPNAHNTTVDPPP
jgi:hypothetical protein